jgi:hypothetical protein
VRIGALRHADNAEHARNGRDRKNRPEKTAPAEPFDEDAADGGADRHREPVHLAPDRNCSSPLGRIWIGHVVTKSASRQNEHRVGEIVDVDDPLECRRIGPQILLGALKPEIDQRDVEDRHEHHAVLAAHSEAKTTRQGEVSRPDKRRSFSWLEIGVAASWKSFVGH